MTDKKPMMLKDRLALAALTSSEYVASGMSDTAFARMAADRLGVLVSANQFAYVRQSLEIPNNEIVRREAKAAAAPRQRELLASGSVIKALVARIEKLEAAAHVHSTGPVAERVRSLHGIAEPIATH